MNPLIDSLLADVSCLPTACTFDVRNPMDNGLVGRVENVSDTQVATAIQAAKCAFASWRSYSVSERGRCLTRWGELLQQHQHDLAHILTLESGKPITQAKGEITHCAGMLEWFAREALTLSPQTLNSSNTAQTNSTRQQPIGVVACITPWNFPAAAVVVKAGAALAAGNTVLLKPSEETPLIACALARLASQAGIPQSALQVLTSDRPQSIGALLCSSKDIGMVSFTGSTGVGKTLYQSCAGTLKRMALELGGNAPFVVFDDADINNTLDSAMNARFYNSGQICVGANRFLIQSTIYPQFCDQLAARIKALNVGDGLQESTEIGPLINNQQAARLDALVADAKQQGATILVDGGRTAADSRIFKPMLLSNMHSRMRAANEEVFGPVACLYKFDSEAQALSLANNTRAGLAAYVFSKNSRRINTFIDQLEAGVVGANTANIFSLDLPFGGIKESGFGREHGHGCLDDYLQTKSVCEGLPE